MACNLAREELGVTSRTVAADKPGQVFAAGAVSRCSQEAVGSAAEPSFPAAAQCGEQQGGVSPRELRETIHIFKGLASCSRKLPLCRVESAPALRTIT